MTVANTGERVVGFLMCALPPLTPRYERANSPSVGSRPCGVYLSTAVGSSRESLASSSSRESPVCFVKVSNTSGPIACSSSDGVTGLFGPVPTQELAVPPCPVCLKRSTSSPKPPLRSPPAPASPRVPFNSVQQAAETTLPG